MSELLEILVRELERPREITAQVARHLAANYGITDDEIGPFLVDTLPTLEEDEVDLILSPLFTPKLDDQAVVAAQLGAATVPEAEQHRLVADVVARPTHATFVTSDGESFPYRLGEVTVERYVYRLRLEGSIPDPVNARIQQLPVAERPLLQAIARRAIWEGGRSSILEGFLSATGKLNDRDRADAGELLDLVERYKPTDIGDLVAKIPLWQEELRGDLGIAAGGSPFFSERIAQDHGGQRDQRLGEGVMIEAKKKDLAFLVSLEQLLVR